MSQLEYEPEEDESCDEQGATHGGTRIRVEDDPLEESAEEWDTHPETLCNPFPHFVFIHQVLEGKLAHLRPADQLIYLHLVRESFGRGRMTVRITMREMGARTGLGKRAVEEGLKRLVAEHYVSVASEGRGKIPTTYHVHRPPSPPRSSLSHTQKPSVESTLAQLAPDDYQLLLTIARSLPLSEKQELEEAVHGDFQQLGLRPDPPLFRQAFLYRVLEHHMYHNMRQKYPALFL